MHAFRSTLVAVALTLPATAQGNRVDSLIERAKKSLEGNQPGRAVQLLKLAFRLEPKHDDLKPMLAAAHLELGTSFYDRKQFARARDAIRAGIGFDKDNPGLWLGLGFVTQEMKRFKESEQAMRKVLELDAEQFDAHVALATLLYEQNRHKEALAFAKRAAELKPDDEKLQTLLDRLGKDAKIESGFRAKRSRHFEVRFHGKRKGLERYVPEILRFLEQSWSSLAREIGVKPKDQIVVLLYTQTEFGKLKTTADWIGAYYDGKVRVPLDSWSSKKRSVQKTIRHELAHAFLSDAVPGLSPWLQEGVAQWTEGVRVDRARDKFRAQPMAPAKMLRAPFTRIKNEKVVALLYAQSLVAYAHLREMAGSNVIRRLLHEIGKRKGSYIAREKAALLAVCGKDLDKILIAAAKRHHLAAPGR